MSSTNDLVSRLTATLVTKAEEITVTKTEFDPERPTSLDLDAVPIEPAASRIARQPRRMWSVAAAVLAVVAIAGAVVVVSRGGDSGPTADTTDTTTTAPPQSTGSAQAPDGALVPTWVPDGLELQTVTWTNEAYGGEWSDQTVQLFGDPGEGVAVAIRIQAPSSGESIGDALTVRGLPATVTPSKYSADATEISWQEDATVIANVRGLTNAEAAAFLGGLTWRSDDRQEGFADPADPALPLVGEGFPGTPAPTMKALFSYSSPDGRFLEVSTTTGAGATTNDYLLTAFYGGLEGDVAVWWDEPFGNLVVAWPDGKRYWIDSRKTISDRATLQQVADGIHEGTGADIDAMLAEIATRTVALPLVASVELSAGTLELRGNNDDAGNVLCLRRTGSEDIDCGTLPTTLSSGMFGVGLAVSIDGVWYVAAASTVEQPVVGGGGSDEPIPSETGADGEWMFVLAQPPDGVDQVSVTVGNNGTGFTRPS